MEEVLMELLSQSPLIATLMFLVVRGEARVDKAEKRLDNANEKLYSLIPDKDTVALPTDDLKAVNPQNAMNVAKLATGGN